MNHSVEITKEAAWALIGNDEQTWHHYKQDEVSETTCYLTHGVLVSAVCNYLSGSTQYYIQDINA
jgi:hypothetical protein